MVPNQRGYMKRIVVILFLLLSVSVFADDFRFYSFGEFAYYPMKEDKYIPKGIYFSTNIGIGAEYKWFFIEVNQEVDILKSEAFYFSPYKEKYYLTAGINLWIIQVGYQHLCTHNVDRSYGYKDQYDKVYINFDTRKLK